MKKIVLILLLLTLLMSGCAKATVDSPGTIDAQAPPIDLGSELEMTMITSFENLFMCRFAGTEEGCYQSIMNQKDLSANLVYYDYETRKLVHLTSQLNPVNDETNDGWIQDCFGGADIFTYGEKLYLSNSGQRYIQSEDQAFAAKITQMNLDGSNKQTIEFPDNMEINANGGLAFDGENIYLTLWVYDTNTGENLNTSLCKISFDTGEYEIMDTFDNNGAFLSIRNVYQDGLVLSHYAMDASNNPSVKFIKYSMLTHEIIDSFDVISDYGYNQVFINGKMYYGKPETREIWVLNIDTMTNEMVFDVGEKLPDTEDLVYLDVARISHDEHLLFRLTNIETDQSKASIIKDYGYDTRTGEIIELTLTGKFGSSGADAKLEILAENTEYFLVGVGESMKSMPYYDSDGVQMYYSDLFLNVKLIKKEDYWHSIPNYIEFEDSVFVA